MSVLYNENDHHAAAWLRRLAAAGHLPPGRVDSRSIVSLKPSDLDGYTSFHTFAGIGGWPLALRLAGWPDDRPVWTGSCPCQPFSDAGDKQGFEDERHLWPAFFSLIRECRPDVVFGEQVSSKDGLEWFDVVRSDLEREGYACGALDTCAASVGAPHRRQRLFFVASLLGHSGLSGSQGCREREEPRSGGRGAEAGGSMRVADGDSAGLLRERTEPVHDQGARGDEPGGCRPILRMGDSSGDHLRGERGGRAATPREGGGAPRERERLRDDDRSTGRADDPEVGIQSIWDRPDWALCDDPGGPRWRPIEPGTFPLAHGVPERVGRLRGYGNAIVPQLGAQFVRSFMETCL